MGGRSLRRGHAAEREHTRTTRTRMRAYTVLRSSAVAADGARLARGTCITCTTRASDAAARAYRAACCNDTIAYISEHGRCIWHGYEFGPGGGGDTATYMRHTRRLPSARPEACTARRPSPTARSASPLQMASVSPVKWGGSSVVMHRVCVKYVHGVQADVLRCMAAAKMRPVTVSLNCAHIGGRVKLTESESQPAQCRRGSRERTFSALSTSRCDENSVPALIIRTTRGVPSLDAAHTAECTQVDCR